jgi:hypothetical protein
MASPYVTGGAALVWSQNPTWTAQEVKNQLLQTTDPISALSQTVSGGRLNINTALGGSTPPPPPPPLVPNDNFADRILLAGVPVSTTGSNIGATAEPQEPAQSGPINSAWWSWTAPTTGLATFDTIGSNFDTWLSVYTGSDLPNLTLIGFDDQGGGNNTSLLSLNAIAGETYQIAVDGWSSNTGQIALNIMVVPPPANDNFVNQIPLTGETATTKGSNRGATGEVGEPTQSGVTNSAWWSWTAPTTGLYNIDSRGSNFDTWLSVFTGSAVNNLSLIGFDDQEGGNNTSLLSLNATAGTTYRIAVDGFSSITGAIQLNIAPPPPPNDNFANRIALTGDTANATGTNRGATGELGEPAQSGQINSVWWTSTAPTTGNYTFDTIGSGSDTYLSLFTGTNLPSLALVAADDDGGGSLTSRITQSVTAGTTYQIAVDGWSDRTDPINLNIAPTPLGSAGTDKLTETANNTLKGEPGKDLLTGGTGAGSLILPFAESSVSASPDTDLTIDKKRDPLTEGGAALNAPSLFSLAANSPVPILEKDLSPVFSEANGALARTQPLAVNSEPFGVAKTSPFAYPYLVGVYEARPLGI